MCLCVIVVVAVRKGGGWVNTHKPVQCKDETAYSSDRALPK